MERSVYMSESTPIRIHVLSEIQNQHDDEKETIEVSTTGEYILKEKPFISVMMKLMNSDRSKQL